MTDLTGTSHPALTAVLGSGELQLTGRLMSASNATFLAELTCGEVVTQCVYKPIGGERPLWDFPRGTLGLREVAAYEVSRLGGFDVVPVTVLADGPLGTGSLQVWVEEDPAQTEAVVDLVPTRTLPREGWFDVVEGTGVRDESVSVIHADDPRLRMMAVFDALINNADRKGGHILGSGGRVFGVDHGIGFHIEPKLRTLLWGWAGEPLTAAELTCVRKIGDDVADVLGGLLSEIEIVALLERAEKLIRRGTLPRSPRGSWPAIPWPPF
ncbi:MAG: SCO1664 family protein [Propionibacteriaceae bacterium]